MVNRNFQMKELGGKLQPSKKPKTVKDKNCVITNYKDYHTTLSLVIWSI